MSRTLTPQRCKAQADAADACATPIYWDCPGFEDTRDVSMDVVSAFSITKIGAHVRQIKLLVVVEEAAITGARRGQAFRHMLDSMFAMFPDILT
jgi:hypothetical protein